jgi:hypothetical protein
VTHATESMELNGALSNPLESNKNPLERLSCVVRDLVGRECQGPKPRPLPKRPGEIAEAVRAIVNLCEEPARMIEIHAAVESLLRTRHGETRPERRCRAWRVRSPRTRSLPPASEQWLDQPIAAPGVSR